MRINMTKMRTSVKTGMITWKLLERASARAQGAETNLTNLWWVAGKSKLEEGRGRSTGRKSRRTTIPDDVGKINSSLGFKVEGSDEAKWCHCCEPPRC